MFSSRDDTGENLLNSDPVLSSEPIPLKSHQCNVGRSNNVSGNASKSLQYHGHGGRLNSTSPAEILNYECTAATSPSQSPRDSTQDGVETQNGNDGSDIEGRKARGNARKRGRRRSKQVEAEHIPPEDFDEIDNGDPIKKQRVSRKGARGAAIAPRVMGRGRGRGRGVTRSRKELDETSSDESQTRTAVPEPVPTEPRESKLAELPEFPDAEEALLAAALIKAEIDGYDSVDPFPSGIRRGRRIVKPPSIMYAAITPPTRARTRASRGGRGRKPRPAPIGNGASSRSPADIDVCDSQEQYRRCEVTPNYHVRDKAAVWNKILSSERKDKLRSSENKVEPAFLETMLYEAWKDTDDVQSNKNDDCFGDILGEMTLYPWNPSNEKQQKSKNFEYSLLLMSSADAKSTSALNSAVSEPVSRSSGQSDERIRINGRGTGRSTSTGDDQMRSVVVTWHQTAQCWVCSFVDPKHRQNKATFSAVILGYEEARRQSIQFAASACIKRRTKDCAPTDVIPAVFFDAESQEWTATGVVTRDGGNHIEVLQRIFSVEMIGSFLEARKQAIQWLINITTEVKESNSQSTSSSASNNVPRLSEQDRSLLLLFVMLIQQQQKQQQERQQQQLADQQQLVQLQQFQQQLSLITGMRADSEARHPE